jgi:DNA-binding CsgD family transcriptional regulator
MTRQPAENPAVLKAMLSRVLDRRERKILSLALFDRLTQEEIGRRMRCPQTTIGYQLRRAEEKLKAAGVRVPKPAKVETENVVTYVDPADLIRLTVSGGQGGRNGPKRKEWTRPIGRWVDAEKQIRQE